VFVALLPVRAGNEKDDGRIAFVGNQSGNWQLYTMNPDGTDMAQITNLAATNFDLWVPDFSPDGRKIVFCYGTGPSASLAPQTEIYVINVDGSGLTQITHDGLFDCAPRWSPDGSLITFIAESNLTQQTVVTTMRPDGSHRTGLTTPFWGAFRSGYTPDARRIVFESQQAGYVSVIWRMNADGSRQRRLTAAPIRAGNVAVSPDGEHVAFNSNQNSPIALATAIFVMDLDGTDIRQLTQPIGVSHDLFADYSPDGRKIVFASDRMSSDGSLDIFTMNANGSSLTRIATGITVGGCGDDNCVNPAWGRKP
jgi:Tol biopolymer transport system component